MIVHQPLEAVISIAVETSSKPSRITHGCPQSENTLGMVTMHERLSHLEHPPDPAGINRSKEIFDHHRILILAQSKIAVHLLLELSCIYQTWLKILSSQI